jgi:hypothetical protein
MERLYALGQPVPMLTQVHHIQGIKFQVGHGQAHADSDAGGIAAFEFNPHAIGSRRAEWQIEGMGDSTWAHVMTNYHEIRIWHVRISWSFTLIAALFY